MWFWIAILILLVVILFASYNFWLSTINIIKEIKVKKEEDNLNNYLYDWSFLNNRDHRYIERKRRRY